MKLLHGTVCLILILNFGLAVHADEATTAERPTSATLSSTAAPADYDLLRNALEEAHPGLYRYSSKSQIDQMFDSERAKLGAPLTKLAFREIVAQTVASIHCGHTSLEGDAEMDAAMKAAATLPLRVLMEGSHVHVLVNDTADDRTILPGMEIIEINGHKVNDLLTRFYAVTSGDGDILSGKNHDLSNRFGQYYWWLIEQPREFTIKAVAASGNEVIAKLPGVTDAQRRSNHNPANAPIMAAAGKFGFNSPENFSLRFIKEPDIAEIRIRYFLGDKFATWMNETFKTLHDKKTKTLIIDLRGNGGGVDEYGALFVSELTDKPFRYFDRIELKTFTPTFSQYVGGFPTPERRAEFAKGTAPNAKGGFLLTPAMNRGLLEQQPAEHPFLGTVFVLIDGGSFSCAADVAAVLHHLKRATFIGDETGGAYYGNNSGMMLTLTLPNSNVKIRLPFYEYWNAVEGYPNKRRGTIPDYPVMMKTADVLRGIDAQHALAVKLAEESTAGN